MTCFRNRASLEVKTLEIEKIFILTSRLTEITEFYKAFLFKKKIENYFKS